MGKPRLPDVEKQEMLDLPMLLLTLLLTALGLVMIYSSSFARASMNPGTAPITSSARGFLPWWAPRRCWPSAGCARN